MSFPGVPATVGQVIHWPVTEGLDGPVRRRRPGDRLPAWQCTVPRWAHRLAQPGRLSAAGAQNLKI
eukprot:141121-Hanusia_phi.AAC.1